VPSPTLAAVPYQGRKSGW